MSALKYSRVRIRHMCTGDRSTPKKPAAKANDIVLTDAFPAMLMINGNVLPTNPTVMPVSMPVMNGSRNRIGSAGIPSCTKNRLRFPTAPEFSIASLKTMTPNIRIITSIEKPCFSDEKTDFNDYR